MIVADVMRLLLFVGRVLLRGGVGHIAQPELIDCYFLSLLMRDSSREFR